MKNITKEIQKTNDLPNPEKEKDALKLMKRVVMRTGSTDSWHAKEKRLIVQREGFIYGTDFSMVLRLKSESSNMYHMDLQGNVFPAQYAKNQTVHRPEKEYMMPNFQVVIPEPEKTQHIKTLSDEEVKALYQLCQKGENYQKKEGSPVAVRLTFGTSMGCFNPMLLADAFRFILQAGEGEINLSLYKGPDYIGFCLRTENALVYTMPLNIENETVYSYLDLSF